MIPNFTPFYSLNAKQWGGVRRDKKNVRLFDNSSLQNWIRFYSFLAISTASLWKYIQFYFHF